MGVPEVITNGCCAVNLDTGRPARSYASPGPAGH